VVAAHVLRLPRNAVAGVTDCEVARLKVAVTAWSVLIVTVQVPVPEQAPDHPANVEPVAGFAVRVTTA
jgi:hypothetical protein